MATKTNRKRPTGDPAEFVRQYVGPCRGNATLAAERAGYSEKSSRVIGCQLLTRANIQQAIAQAREANALASQMSVEQWRRGLESVATFDPANMFTQGGSVLLPCDMDPATRAGLAGFDIVERRVKTGEKDDNGRDVWEVERICKVKFRDSLRAHQLLGEHFAWLATGKGGDTVNIYAAMAVGGPERPTRAEWEANQANEKARLLSYVEGETIEGVAVDRERQT